MSTLRVNTITDLAGTPFSTSGSGFAAGTTLLFYQAAAPTGWTQVTTHNNKALRVVSGTGGGSGGTSAFTSVFASRTLTTAQIPSHTHSYTASNSDNVSTYAWEGGSGMYQTDNSGTFGATTGSEGSGSAIDFAVQYIDVILCSKT